MDSETLNFLNNCEIETDSTTLSIVPGLQIWQFVSIHRKLRITNLWANFYEGALKIRIPLRGWGINYSERDFFQSRMPQPARSIKFQSDSSNLRYSSVTARVFDDGLDSIKLAGELVEFATEFNLDGLLVSVCLAPNILRTESRTQVIQDMNIRIESFLVGGSTFEPRMPAICQGCTNLHGQRYSGVMLVCAMHPYGNGENCADYEARATRPHKSEPSWGHNTIVWRPAE